MLNTLRDDFLLTGTFVNSAWTRGLFCSPYTIIIIVWPKQTQVAKCIFFQTTSMKSVYIRQTFVHPRNIERTHAHEMKSTEGGPK